jgi:hypothetical protein
VPVGLVALLVVARVLELPHTRRDHRIDWLGALTLVVGLVPLLVSSPSRAGPGAGPPGARCCVI